MSAIESVTAAGGVVYKQSKSNLPQVLLIFRRKVWDLPKGKIEEGETIKECAVREVAEELGLSAKPKISFTLIDTYHEYEQDGTKFGKTTYWFGMRLDSMSREGFDPETEEGIEKVRWTSLADAKMLVGYDNLINVLNSFEYRFKNE
jgi:8-oxo-dGTP pyrophosphatase MutT (NUDIX family)